MSRELEAINEAIAAALEAHLIVEVLYIATKTFVSITEELSRRHGSPLDRPIMSGVNGHRGASIFHAAQTGERHG